MLLQGDVVQDELGLVEWCRRHALGVKGLGRRPRAGKPDCLRCGQRRRFPRIRVRQGEADQGSSQTGE